MLVVLKQASQGISKLKPAAVSSKDAYRLEQGLLRPSVAQPCAMALTAPPIGPPYTTRAPEHLPHRLLCLRNVEQRALVSLDVPRNDDDHAEEYQQGLVEWRVDGAGHGCLAGLRYAMLPTTILACALPFGSCYLKYFSVSRMAALLHGWVASAASENAPRVKDGVLRREGLGGPC
ncbi:hypothetical protein K437DRAFT_171224 [Tilletiaria anomala UBC 951]|uniref:Uncharacterized protein n=1 Tax=Tilletiaria anomala (strain ATCC 24038 / CBS 436.72 / UBC 951) TaxID=1037660 RepID=A0A066VS96_TILAU|nr:uncharacterized protein K437DRAFT_171224 [Tilletiaria anomala UBC 951]KDN41679.1 hypothetical protein K437DRAFT_171224 [Tilletiaria anomala UBC 951]